MPAQSTAILPFQRIFGHNFFVLPPNNMYKHRGEDEQFAVKRVERMLVMFAENHAQNLQSLGFEFHYPAGVI